MGPPGPPGAGLAAPHSRTTASCRFTAGAGFASVPVCCVVSGQGPRTPVLAVPPGAGGRWVMWWAAGWGVAVSAGLCLGAATRLPIATAGRPPQRLVSVPTAHRSVGVGPPLACCPPPVVRVQPPGLRGGTVAGRDASRAAGKVGHSTEFPWDPRGRPGSPGGLPLVAMAVAAALGVPSLSSSGLRSTSAHNEMAAYALGGPTWRRTLKQAVLRALGDVLVWATAYLWFFKSIHLIDALTTRHPALGGATYVLLSSFPVFCLRYHVFVSSITKAVHLLAVLSGSLVAQHCLYRAIRPLQWSLEATLLFFASNLLVNAIPDEFHFRLPPQWQFLTAGGGAPVLSGADVSTAFQTLSSRVLRTIVSTIWARYLMAAKDVPPNLPPDAPGNGLVLQYWAALRRGRGPALVVDLLLNASIAAFTVLEWMGLLHIAPETVLTFGGVGGLALGLASQTVVGACANLVAGLLLLVTQPFAVGDEICTGGRRGVVRRIGWSATVVEEQDGSIALIPNQSIVGQETVNLSVAETRVLSLTLPVTVPDCAEAGPPLLASVADLLRGLPALEGHLVEGPRAFFDFSSGTRPPQLTLTVEAPLDGRRVSTDDLDVLRSTVLLALAAHLKQQNAAITGLA